MGSSRQKSPPSALQSLFTLIRVSLSLRDLNAKTLDDDALFTLSFEMITASGRVQCTQIRSSFSHRGERKDDVHRNRLKSSSEWGKTTFRFSNRRDVFFAKKKRNNGRTSSSNNTKIVMIVSASSSSSNTNNNRKYNFSAGPAMLPLDVLEDAQKDLVD